MSRWQPLIGGFPIIPEVDSPRDREAEQDAQRARWKRTDEAAKVAAMVQGKAFSSKAGGAQLNEAGNIDDLWAFRPTRGHPVNLDPRVQLAVDHAIAKKHRIDACPHCGGPRVYSKTRSRARCFRCTTLFELSHVTTKSSSFRRCELCGEQSMSGRSTKAKLCAKCAALTDAERTKRRRWKAEREGEAAKAKPPEES